jgi:hypothetical protein
MREQATEGTAGAARFGKRDEGTGDGGDGGGKKSSARLRIVTGQVHDPAPTNESRGTAAAARFGQPALSGVACLNQLTVPSSAYRLLQSACRLHAACCRPITARRQSSFNIIDMWSTRIS